MKNRKIPYGYEMKNGAVVINGAEAETVKNIFSEYVNGLVLKDIAATLKAQGAEYLPGETDWNKSRVKRIIDDARYCGNEKCPEIINRLIHSPSLTENGEDKGYTESQDVILKTAEIERMTASPEVDITAVQKLIFECAEEKYRENETARHITERMKAELIDMAPLSEFSGEIFSRTVKATVMEKDGTVRLTLKNGTVLGKGD